MPNSFPGRKLRRRISDASITDKDLDNLVESTSRLSVLGDEENIKDSPYISDTQELKGKGLGSILENERQ